MHPDSSGHMGLLPANRVRQHTNGWGLFKPTSLRPKQNGRHYLSTLGSLMNAHPASCPERTTATTVLRASL
eukprot:5714395-Heterocapsa_arctica.AAC.1